MANKVSVIIPSRNERYLILTVNDVLGKAAGEVECVVVLEDFGKPTVTPSKDDWAKVQAQHGNRLHTIYHHEAKGMRPAINAAAASAISRGAKYLLKLDAHCMVDEGWDEKLKADCDADWIVVPRRKRLDPTTWTNQDVGKPDIDYHYLSFPDDPADFGGPGLNGKPWNERIKARLGKTEYDLDDEMSSQGSAWFMHAAYFQRMGFMDTASYGPFWNEFQELGLSCWLSGGQVKVNKRTWYSHWHKGKAGTGYSKPESWLKQGRNHTMKWAWNEASDRQTRPFEWLIDHFWPVPTWPENWREVLYAERKPRVVAVHSSNDVGDSGTQSAGAVVDRTTTPTSVSLIIHSAHYGPTGTEIDVADKLRELVKGDTLDLMVGNTVLGVGNPFRGQKKKLYVVYSWGDSNERYPVTTDERDWLIIGQSERFVPQPRLKCVVCGKATDSLMAPIAETDEGVCSDGCADKWRLARGQSERFQPAATVEVSPQWLEGHSKDDVEKVFYGNTARPMTPTALNDYLIRKFQIPSHRLRGPMPIELPNFHRNDLAKLFAELGFNRGAEIGVAEGKYSEVLLKANPELSLLLVDPWGTSEGNKQQKTPEKQLYAFNETKRKTQGYKHAAMMQRTSMEAVRDIQHELLDFVYIDGNHSFDYVMQDLIEWSKRVRSGGLVCGDDLITLDEKRWGAGPIEAVQAYVKAHRIPIWFICDAHRSVDYLWVRP